MSAAISRISWSDLDLASLEAEVFLLGHWKNYEELENQLSVPELNATLKALQQKERRNQVFHAAIQGIDLNEGSEPDSTDKQNTGKATTLAELVGRAEAKLSGNMNKAMQYTQGFTDDMGLDYVVEGLDG